MQTITYDNGREFSAHELVNEGLDCQSYFAKPYHSWERGLNENTNGLIRQYFLKGMDLRVVSREEIAFVMERTNCPIVITRGQMPIKNLHEMWVTVVDPALPPAPKPTPSQVAIAGGHCPLRSMIRAKTMNWNTGSGFYELEQFYTAYKNQNYSTCRVRFTAFNPGEPRTQFGCGIRKIVGEYEFHQNGGVIITIGKDQITSPDDPTGLQKIYVDYVGTALIVKNAYKPEYRFVPAHQGNHTFMVPVRENLTYKYMIAGTWSEGSYPNKPEEFKAYVLKTAMEYNNPVVVNLGSIELRKD